MKNRRRFTLYIYLTSGTPEFMESLKNKYANENMIVMYGTGNSLLLHETEGKSVFATPRKFEVLDAVGELDQRGFFVLNNIPVTEEGRPVFEHRFLNRAKAVENEPGFLAFRLLRPIKSDTYIVMTQWSGPYSFDAWKNSNAYKQAHENREKPTGIGAQNIFSTAPYITTYSAQQPENEE